MEGPSDGPGKEGIVYNEQDSGHAGLYGASWPAAVAMRLHGHRTSAIDCGMAHLPKTLDHRRRQALSSITLMLEHPELVEPERWAWWARELEELGAELERVTKQRPQGEQ